MTSITLKAMVVAARAHHGQLRKYTGVPYFDHLAEVAGIAAAAGHLPFGAIGTDTVTCVAFLHDILEDTTYPYDELHDTFGQVIAGGVWWLSDINMTGNRAQRKAQSCERLAAAPGWVQTIKLADLMSNTASIVHHDPAFARVYIPEKLALLDALKDADRDLHTIVRAQALAAAAQLGL